MLNAYPLVVGRRVQIINNFFFVIWLNRVDDYGNICYLSTCTEFTWRLLRQGGHLSVKLEIYGKYLQTPYDKFYHYCKCRMDKRWQPTGLYIVIGRHTLVLIFYSASMNRRHLYIWNYAPKTPVLMVLLNSTTHN